MINKKLCRKYNSMHFSSVNIDGREKKNPYNELQSQTKYKVQSL